MAAEVVVQKARLRKMPEGIFGHPSGKLLISYRHDIYGFGFCTIIFKFGAEDFGQIAKAMRDANANEAIKAFGAAMQLGIVRKSESAKNSN